MTTPGGPGQPGGPAGPWQGGGPDFGVPQPHQPPPIPPPIPPATPPAYQQPFPQAVPPQPQAPVPHGQPQQTSPGHGAGPGQAPASRVGAHGKAPQGRGDGSGPHWGRIALVAGGAVVVVALVVVAGMWLLGGSGGETVGATEKFFTAIKTQDTEAAKEVTCRQASTLAEQMGRGIKGIEGSLGTFDKAVVTAPSTTTSGAPNPNPADKRDSTDFTLQFANGSVTGRAILVSEDDRWKVCFVDLDPPRPG